MSEITSRKEIYRISKPRREGVEGQGAGDINLADVEQQIETLAQEFAVQTADGQAEPAARVIDRLENSRRGHHTSVVEMTEDVKKAMERRHGNNLIIAPDIEYDQFRDGLVEQMVLPMNHFLADTDQELSFKIRVQGPDGQKISGAKVSLQGSLWYDEGLTNAQGRVDLTMFEETLDSLRTLIVKPVGGYWSRVVKRPALVTGRVNTITITPLGAGVGQEDFPEAQLQSWGMADMGLDQPTDANAEVRVAVIDSGIDGSHPDLDPEGGRDFGDSADPDTTWTNDGSGHGTHVTGMVSGVDNAFGIVGGTAPGVKVFANRVFPQARISKLIKAIDWCIDNQIDVVNMSLGGKGSDQGFEDALLDARDAGILCIAATGNSASGVMYPAKYETVLAVAALGKLGSFPADSAHASRISDKAVGDYFAASFTCFGPEVDVCAPGVAIISTIPGDSYAAWDGTSMACPHVAGFAARLLQEKDALRNMPRTADRANALFQAIKESCSDLGLPAEYQGAGLPSLRNDLPPPPDPKPDDAKTSERRAIKMIDEALAILTPEAS